MTIQLTTRSGMLAFADALARRESFTTGGALRGESYRGFRRAQRLSALHFGSLPQPYIDDIIEDPPVYVVYSYDTPIAWLAWDGKWVSPHTCYRRVCSSIGRHQAIIESAISVAH